MTDPRPAIDRLIRNMTTPPAGVTTETRCVTATVASIGPDTTKDGLSLVRVTWNGGTVAASYLSSYTPVVGHVVDCGYNGATLHIHGRIVGIPPEV